jgi:hypothetical protein
MGKRGDDFIIILDVNAVFSSEDVARVEAAGHQLGEPAPAAEG